MREIHRTLTLRLPILAISVTCGCALNFGQVNASGTVNATADTKIDTTVNASASVKQNDVQPTASPAPSATPTNAPDPGPGTLYVHHVPKLSGPNATLEGDIVSRSATLAYLYMGASSERDQWPTRIRFTQEGDASLSEPLLVNLKIGVGSLAMTLDETVNGVADFSKKSGLFVIRASKSSEIVQVDVNWTFNYPVHKNGIYDRLFSARSFRLVIKSANDIETQSGAKVEGDFPLYGPRISFCCK